jgi:hypothetical protein
MIDRSFIEKIEQMATAGKTVIIDGRTYSLSSLVPVLDPTPHSIGIVTLTGMADYLNNNPDGLDMGSFFIHVADCRCVRLQSKMLRQWRQRDLPIVAAAKQQEYPFGQFLSVENFIIALQSYFVQTKTTADIIKVVGNLTDSKVTNFNDDGVTQQVTAKAGIAKVENIPVPNPVTLAPYRTFLEIEQPESKFIFRMQSAGDGRPPLCALFQADGGSWELQAIERIRDWLRGSIPKEMVILA